MKAKARILIGGGRIWAGETKEIDKYIVSLVKQQCLNLNVLFLPTASQDREEYINAFEEEYRSLGCCVNTLRLYSEKYSKKSLNSMFQNSSIVYLGAGNPHDFDVILKRKRLYKHFMYLLRDFNGILVGLSAGAALLCDGYIDISKGNNIINQGWGIIKHVIVVPHCKEGWKLDGEYLRLRDLEIACFSDNLICKKTYFKDGE